MAESKSAYFCFEINAHSEKIEKFEPLSINSLSVGSEWLLPCYGRHGRTTRTD
jgi:hypothetical protein